MRGTLLAASVSRRTPMPSDARWLVIWRDRTKLYEECIPAPPAVSLDCNVSASDESYRLDWAASTLDPCDIWYLVQWEDLDGTWRGLAPRTRERSMTVPGQLMSGRTTMRVRVLATSGLATGSAAVAVRPPVSRSSATGFSEQYRASRVASARTSLVPRRP